MHDPEAQSSSETNNDDVSTNPALQAIRSLRNVFHATKGHYGSINSDTTVDPTLRNKNRVGQNLLLRNVIPEDDKDDDDKGTNETTTTIDVLASGEPTTDGSTKKKKKSKKKTKGDEFDKQMKKPVEDNPFGKSNIPDNVEQLKPHMPRQNAVLWIFHLIQGLGVVGGLGLIISQLIPFFLIRPQQEIINRIGIVSIALKCYIIIICFLFIVNEMDIPGLSLIRNAMLLQGYLTRGFLYTFIGLICVESAYSDRIKDIVQHRTKVATGSTTPTDNVDWISIYIEFSSWFMVFIGLIYALLGLCCLKRIRDKLKQQEIDRWTEYRREMKRWKDLYG